MAPRVSVVIPTFNRATLVERAIDSVLGQTHSAFEIIVVDDGSTDNTSATLRNKYSDKLVVFQQSNRGVSAARNVGIAHATGNWIALLDSDDEWLPSKLAQQLALIKNHTDCLLCHTDEIWIRNSVRVNAMNKHKKSGGDIYQQCLPLCAISPSSVIFQKQLLDDVGNFDETLPACEDYDLWLRICAQHKVHYLDQKLLVKYGGHEDQLSRKHWGMDRFRIKSLQKMLQLNVLSEDKRASTVATLTKKIHILLNGAVKHNNTALIEECAEAIRAHNLPIPDAAQHSPG